MTSRQIPFDSELREEVGLSFRSLPLAAHCSVAVTQQSKRSCSEVLHTHFASIAHFWLLDFYPWSTRVLPTPGFAVFSEFFQASPVACGIVLLSTVTG